MPAEIKSLEKYFWDRVQYNNDDCLIWQGTYDKSINYGIIRLKHWNKKATHVAWYLKYNVWPKYLCHTCNIKGCVKVSHLYDGDFSTNAIDRVMQGNQCVQKLLYTDIDDILVRINNGDKNNSIAKDYNVSTAIISEIKTGRKWSHYTGIKYKRTHRNRLTQEEICDIKKRINNNEILTKISKDIGTSVNTISQIKLGRRYCNDK